MFCWRPTSNCQELITRSRIWLRFNINQKMGSSSHPKKIVQGTHNPLNILTHSKSILWDVNAGISLSMLPMPLHGWGMAPVNTTMVPFPAENVHLFQSVSFYFTRLFLPCFLQCGMKLQRWHFQIPQRHSRISQTKSVDFSTLEIPQHNLDIQIARCICDLTFASKFCRRTSFKSRVLLIKLAKYTLR